MSNQLSANKNSSKETKIFKFVQQSLKDTIDESQKAINQKLQSQITNLTTVNFDLTNKLAEYMKYGVRCKIKYD